MKYTDKDCLKFVADMKRAHKTVEHYRGRHYWQGPAARADNLQDVLSFTRVPCQWDEMGEGYIVYPIASDEGTEEQKWFA